MKNNKLVVAVTLAVLAVGSVAMAAMAQAPERADDSKVEAQIDARLHALLVKAAAARP